VRSNVRAKVQQPLRLRSRLHGTRLALLQNIMTTTTTATTEDTMTTTTTTTVTEKSIKDMDARELFAAAERGVPGAREAYDKKRAERDAIKRNRRYR
jgi:hypothetical protein